MHEVGLEPTISSFRREAGTLSIRPHEQTVAGKCKGKLTNDAAGTGGKFEKIANIESLTTK